MMKIDQLIINRFTQLINVAEGIKRGRQVSGGYDVNSEYRGTALEYDDYYRPQHIPHVNSVNVEAATQWGISCLHILRKVFGELSDHYQNFNKYPKYFNIEDNFDNFALAFSILRAAKDDYENGLLFDTRTLIEAEVFNDFLEQAEHLLNQGYFTASAVIAGSVLEDGLRKLCTKNGITLSAKPKLDAMNAELSKAGVYNLLKQKQITALADLRNKVAHGLGGFTKEDVESMVKEVRRFMTDYLS